MSIKIRLCDGGTGHIKGLPMPTKYCPHCGKRIGFEVKFNVVCRIGDDKEKGYLRICQAILSSRPNGRGVQ